jgi:hypothetical protein
MIRRYLTILTILFALLAPRVGAQGGMQKAEEGMDRTRADLVRATRDYKTSLEKLLGLYESDVKRAGELVEKRKTLFEQGIISRREFEESERGLAEARGKVEEIVKKINEADTLMAEAQAAEELAKSPLPTRGYRATATLIRYNGYSKWAIKDSVKVEGFFTGRFGRALPISAFGQTAVHDRLGFDHSNAIDVAVHPDSPEGQEIMEFLRKAGIPFLAFRTAVPGSATGAHIHIGLPSSRLTVHPPN